MYTEIGFLFNPSLTLDNEDNTSNIYGRKIGIRTRSENGENTTPNIERGVLVYKNPMSTGTAQIKNYLVENVYRNDNSNEDPYISLINYFSDNKVKALKLRAADFAYLTELGVYPINRLWILRRFPDNCIVPNNLTEWGNSVYPISTVVGWMKDKEDSHLLTLNFSEIWTDQNEMVDKVLTQLLKDEFGLRLPNMMSVPGWSQGILFGMLKSMGYTDNFDSMNVPTGDPNVLRKALMREINSQGIKSDINFNLETSYEQKYINGIDPGMAMLDILSNLFKMGTSDQRFIVNANNERFQQIMSNLNSQTNLSAWIDFTKKFINDFLEGITQFIKDLKNDNPDSGVGDTIETDTDQQDRNSIGVNMPDANVISTLGSSINKIGGVLLAGTIAKYRWPLKGSLSLMSGINSTPWHLTIGNPYSPLINIGNIHVSNVEVKWSNDMGFNDMPIRIDVNITANFGRPLGKQELERMFNNGYKRVYSQRQLNDLSDSIESSSLTNASSISTPMNVISNQTQPFGTESAYISTGNGISQISINTYP